MGTRVRVPGVWFAGAALFALLMFTYKYLDFVARQVRVPFYFPLIEEFTGVFGAVALFPLVRHAVRRFPLTRRTWLARLPVHVAVLIAFSALHTTSNWLSRVVLFRLLGLGDYDYGLIAIRYAMELPIDVVLYTLFASGVWLFDKVAAEREAALRAAQLESELRQAQLQGLRLQLQPHFLFNALNTISSAMYDDPRAADTMLSRLAELLRVSLRTTQTQVVPLATELDALDHYVALLRARFGDRLSLQVDVPPPLRRALVPSLILQPLVENAVRHGNLSKLGTGRIRVGARVVDAALAGDDERLRIEVEDDGPGPPAGVDVRSSGIGVASTIARLRLLYGEAHRFETHVRPGVGFQVALDVPLRTAEKSVAAPMATSAVAPAAPVVDTPALEPATREEPAYARAHRG